MRKQFKRFFFAKQNSSNGVFVQEERIPPGIATPLRDKDVLELGKDPKTGKAHYSFRFYKAAYIRVGGPDSSSKENVADASR